MPDAPMPNDAVDTGAAARRLRDWNDYGEGADSATPNARGYTYDSLDFQRDLQALLTEREDLDHMCKLAIAQRIAAEAQRDAARGEARKLREAAQRALTDLRGVDKYMNTRRALSAALEGGAS